MNKLIKTPKRIVQISYDDGCELAGDELRWKIIRVAQKLNTIGTKYEDDVGVVCDIFLYSLIESFNLARLTTKCQWNTANTI